MKSFYRNYKIVVVLVIAIVIVTSCNHTEIRYYGDEISRDTLHICMDTENLGCHVDEYYTSEQYNKIAEQIKNTIGMRVSLEVLPGEGAERETALQRIRTEIMSGGGPDVFIMNTVGYRADEDEGALLNFPEKNMELGLFLPLDEYIADAEYTDWSKQSKQIMDAGRTEEGQLIVPLTYTFPVIVYPKEQMSVPYTTGLTMHEILNDSETAEIGSVMYTSINRSDDLNGASTPLDRILYVLGKTVDYENEELLFTEEELFDLLTEMNDLHKSVENNPFPYLEGQVGSHLFRRINVTDFDSEMSLVPIYSRNGGITATVVSFAAVNSNTAYPEMAFSVIDFMLQEDMQLESELYSFVLGSGELSMQEDIGWKERPMADGSYLEQSLYEDLLCIKNQITEVSFRSEADIALMRLTSDCVLRGEVSRESVSQVYESLQQYVRE